MQLFDHTGKSALGSRLRLFTAMITDDAAKIYESYGLDFTPKWFPVFFVLMQNNEQTITEIAIEIGHSQPSVSKIVREMTDAGLVKENQKTSDKRRNVVALTKKGKSFSEKLGPQLADVEAAVNGLINEATHNLWEALAEWEYLLDQKSMLRRVQDQRKIREANEVEIVPYNSDYQEAFKSLNEEWIARYFEIEETDRKALNNAQSYVIDKGGKIFVALYKGDPVGVCALIKMDDPEYQYEMAKMAVSPKMQGKSIGWLLAQTIIAEAKSLGAKKIYLESNTILKPAINLYHKLGFKKIVGRNTPYARCNIQMELILEANRSMDL